MDGVVIEEGPYNPGDVVEVDYDNSSAHAIGFTLWAHYPNGKPFSEHQIGLINIDTKKTFDWNWEYDAPTCEGLKITWPKDLPHPAIDVNVKVKDLKTGEVITKNFRDADGFELGIEHIFKMELEYFEYQWIQVHGTDYHWKGSVVCGVEPEVPEEPTPEPEVPEVPEEPKEPEVEEPKEPEQPEVPYVPEEPEVSVPDVPEAPEPKEPNVPTLPVTGSAVNWIGYAFAIVGFGMIIVGRRRG